MRWDAGLLNTSMVFDFWFLFIYWSFFGDFLWCTGAYLAVIIILFVSESGGWCFVLFSSRGFSKKKGFVGGYGY